MPKKYYLQVAPSRARGLKLLVHATHGQQAQVAPSRARGLKHNTNAAHNICLGRALTGAWIETSTPSSLKAPCSASRPHGRVD